MVIPPRALQPEELFFYNLSAVEEAVTGSSFKGTECNQSVKSILMPDTKAAHA